MLARHPPTIGSTLLRFGRPVDRPLLILSGDRLAHAKVALSAQHVGNATAALAPAHFGVGDLGKLRDIAGQVTPGAIFVDDAAPVAEDIAAVFAPDLPAIACMGMLSDRAVPAWAEVLATTPTATARRAVELTGPDAMVKFMFTSGTTGSLKAVIQTEHAVFEHEIDARLLCLHGGTFLIDGGDPTPKLIGETICNLHEIAPTWFFNCPMRVTGRQSAP